MSSFRIPLERFRMLSGKAPACRAGTPEGSGRLSGLGSAGTPPSKRGSFRGSKRGSGSNRRGTASTNPQAHGPQTPPGGAQTRLLGTKKTPAAAPLPRGPALLVWFSYVRRWSPGGYSAVVTYRSRAHLPGPPWPAGPGAPARPGAPKAPDGRGAPSAVILTIPITSDPVRRSRGMIHDTAPRHDQPDLFHDSFPTVFHRTRAR